MRIGQAQVVAGLFRQVFDPPAEIIGQVADQAADERKLGARRCACLAKVRQGLAQALGEFLGRFVRSRCKGRHRPGAEQVVASTLGSRATSVQQHGAGCLTHQGETFAGRFLIGKGV
ncbi:hypothetical protein FQZ97_1257330 [compost metagenome]